MNFYKYATAPFQLSRSSYSAHNTTTFLKQVQFFFSFMFLYVPLSVTFQWYLLCWKRKSNEIKINYELFFFLKITKKIFFFRIEYKIILHYFYFRDERKNSHWKIFMKFFSFRGLNFWNPINVLREKRGKREDQQKKQPKICTLTVFLPKKK
jgi:hypothetical protein